MNSLGISHFGIGVTDLERSTRFYRDVLGLEILIETEHEDPRELVSRTDHRLRRSVYFRLSAEAHAPVLVMSSIHPEDDSSGIMLDQRGIHHLALWFEDLPRLIELLAGEGIQPFWGPYFIPRYPVDLTAPDGNPMDAATMCFHDPDGICIQAESRMSGNVLGYPSPF